MKVEVLTSYKSKGVFELAELPTREHEIIVLPDGMFVFLGIGRNAVTGLTELYVEQYMYRGYDYRHHCAEGVTRHPFPNPPSLLSSPEN